MFGLFGSAPLIEPENANWQFECFEWLLRNTGGFKVFAKGSLVLPTNQFFPQRGLGGHALAEALFAQVKEYAGMSDWPCTLEAQDEDVDPVLSPSILIEDVPSSPGGTFSAQEAGVKITYSPHLLANPMSLIAIFAHELAHYFTAAFPEEPPGGWDDMEFATDLTSVFLGFGIFAANSVCTFSQFSIGWQTRRIGYLSEREVVHALAIFSALMGVSKADVLAGIKPSLRGFYKRACKSLSAQGERIERMKAIDGVAVHATQSA